MCPQRIHRESLEQEATHVTDEARMILPGVQAIMGFQLIAVFNQRFDSLGRFEQDLHLAAFFLVTLAMGLIMAPAAYHRQIERGSVTRRFVDLASALLTLSLLPLLVGVACDAFILLRLVGGTATNDLCGAGGVVAVLGGLWFVLPRLIGPQEGGPGR